MLTTLQNVKVKMGITDSSQDAILSALVEEADAQLKEAIGQNIEVNQYIEPYTGEGTRNLILRQRPILVVNNIWIDYIAEYGTSENPFAASPLVQGQDYAPNFDFAIRNSDITIQSVDNTTPITVHATAHKLYTGQIVNIVNNAVAVGSWRITVVDGNTFTLNNSTANGVAAGGLAKFTVSRSGLVMRFGTVWPMIDRVYTPGYLAFEQGPAFGNIKVDYIAGYPVVPADLRYAADMLVAWCFRQAAIGGILQSENIGQYGYTIGLIQQGIQQLGSVGRVIMRYKEFVL